MTRSRPDIAAVLGRSFGTLSLPAAGALLGLLVLPVAIGMRWALLEEQGGRFFHPTPDALEYVASAQSLIQGGSFHLQIGATPAPPRYAPGWPLVLAAALGLGVPPESLAAFTAVWDALAAWGISLAALLLARWLRQSEGAARAADFAGATLAGWGWGLSPVAVNASVGVMSDAPSALLANAALLGCGLLLLGRPVHERGGMLAAGAALGLATTMRPVVGVLALAPVALLALSGALAGSWRDTARRLAWGLAGFALPAGLSGVVAVRAGRLPWRWSTYDFWAPEFYARFGDTFHWRYALQGEELFQIANTFTGKVMGHLEIGLSVLLGMPGMTEPFYSLGGGALWPLLAWVGGGALLFRRIAGESDLRWRRSLILAAAAAGAWVLGHLLLYGFYFFPNARFYLAPLALGQVLLGALFAALLGVRRWRIPAAIAGVIVLAIVNHALEPLRERRVLARIGQTGEEVRAAFASWIALTDEERAEFPVPFDPLRAQALGLLPPERVESIEAWGPLPDTEHVRRLRHRGLLQAGTDEAPGTAVSAEEFGAGPPVPGAKHVAVARAHEESIAFFLNRPFGGIRMIMFGAPGDVPVAGDWNGDGLSDPGVAREIHGERMVFFLDDPDAGMQTVLLGAHGGSPITGDWNGDGITDLGVAHALGDDLVFFLRDPEAGVQTVYFGRAGDVPLTGDWDGDGISDLAVARERGEDLVFELRDPRGDRTVVFGSAGDMALTGDWNDDGITDVGTARYEAHRLIFRLDHPDAGPQRLYFGRSTDVPLTGNFER